MYRGTRMGFPYPDRNLNGDCLKIGPYFVGHSKVSRSIWRVSDKPKYDKKVSLERRKSIEVNRPPISDQATFDFSSLMSLKDKGTKSTWAVTKSDCVRTDYEFLGF